MEIDEISGRRLLLEFKAFGYFKRTCQLELRKNGDSVFSKGMVAKEKGAWRVEVIYVGVVRFRAYPATNTTQHCFVQRKTRHQTHPSTTLCVTENTFGVVDLTYPVLC